MDTPHTRTIIEAQGALAALIALNWTNKPLDVRLPSNGRICTHQLDAGYTIALCDGNGIGIWRSQVFLQHQEAIQDVATNIAAFFTGPRPGMDDLTRLTALHVEADMLRRKLGISNPHEELYRATLNLDRTLIVEADGFGGADFFVVEDVEGGPNNWQIHHHQHFLTETAALNAAETYQDAE